MTMKIKNVARNRILNRLICCIDSVVDSPSAIKNNKFSSSWTLNHLLNSIKNKMIDRLRIKTWKYIVGNCFARLFPFPVRVFQPNNSYLSLAIILTLFLFFYCYLLSQWTFVEPSYWKNGHTTLWSAIMVCSRLWYSEISISISTSISNQPNIHLSYGY